MLVGVLSMKHMNHPALIRPDAANAVHHHHQRRLQQQRSMGDRKPGTPSRYFTAEAVLVLACLTVSLLVLPLVLPPLPPPPSLLLLLPVCLLLLLALLAFMPSDVRTMASSYL